MQRIIKSYVQRAGRISPRQQAGLSSWLKDYQIPADGQTPWDLSAIFENPLDTVVEIGFGMGASLLQMAIENPQRSFIGIEVHQAGIGRLAADLHDKDITNVRLAVGDAVFLFREKIPAQTLAGIQIFFPDPWPKKRHHKRRLITPEFVAILQAALKPGGFIHCATDWEDYAHQMLAVFEGASGLINHNPTGGFSPRPATRPVTKFEHRGTQLGHGVWDLIYVA